VGAVVVWTLVGIDVYLLIYGRIGQVDPPRAITVFVGLFMLLFAWVLTKIFLAARRPTNWVLRIQGNDLLIKYRSFENWRMDENDPQVIELHRDEIAQVRERKERQLSRDSQGSMVAEQRRYLEIQLKSAEDTTAIDRAIAAEVALPGWGNERHSTKWLEYPVAVNDGMIRVTWFSGSSRIRPALKQAVAALGRLVPVGEAQSSKNDFTSAAVTQLPEDQQRAQLADLARRDPLAATRLAKELYHCSLAEAQKKVEQLSGQATAQSSST
jgi:hypothetical protein